MDGGEEIRDRSWNIVDELRWKVFLEGVHGVCSSHTPECKRVVEQWNQTIVETMCMPKRLEFPVFYCVEVVCTYFSNPASGVSHWCVQINSLTSYSCLGMLICHHCHYVRNLLWYIWIYLVNLNTKIRRYIFVGYNLES